MKSPPFCAIINLLDYDTWKGAFFMGRKNPAKNINIGLLAHVDAGKTTPVSYTHLRAHETDSYLVCRLLLEKKKNTKVDKQT